MTGPGGNLRSQYYDAADVLRILGQGLELRDGTYPSLSRTFRDLRSGRKTLVSVSTTDKMLTACGHHLWELSDAETFRMDRRGAA